nr:hypothetical protein [Bacilli bacterium]
MESSRYKIYSNNLNAQIEKSRALELKRQRHEYNLVVQSELSMPEIKGEQRIDGYVKEVLDNYNNMSLEDRIKVNEILEKFYRDNKEYCYSHSYTFKYINFLLENMLKAREFPNFYNSLNSKEQRIIREQIHLGYSLFSPYDEAYDAGLIYKMLNMKYEGKTNDATFTLDENRLNSELADEYICPEPILNVFKVRYAEAALNNVNPYLFGEKDENKLLNRYASPLVIEFKNIMDNTIDFILSYMPSYVKKSFGPRSLKNKISIIFMINSITKEKLDTIIKREEEEAEERKAVLEESTRKNEIAKEKAKRKQYNNDSLRKGHLSNH